MTTRRLTTRGVAFASEVLLDAVREWATDRPRPLRQTAFVTWCAEQADTGRLMPSSYAPFRREFGHWEQTLAHAFGDTRATEPVIFSPADFAAAPATRAVYETDEALAWLAWLAVRMERPSTISAERYDVLVASFNRQAQAAGVPARAPRAVVLLRRFRSWPQARFRAGLCTAADAETRRQGQQFSRNELLDACAAGLLVFGCGMRMRDYDRWSEDEVERRVHAGQQRPAVPRADWIRRRLGGRARSWITAIEETLRCRPAIAQRLGR